MDLHYDIVTILDAENLVDGESYQRRYRTRDGKPLALGNYVVLWDEPVSAPAFNEMATYHGPYESFALARRAAQDLRG